MGITGLLPLLKPACRPADLSQFKGCTVAIDVYCWLHKGAFGCAEQIVQGRFTDGYIKYVMKYINLMLNHNIKPIVVFDGRNLPSKSETEKKRRTMRKENREKGIQFMKEGKVKEARECFQRCVDITPAMAREVIQACRERNVDCIVAPYEADSQLAYLNMAGLADIVVTEDSDLTLFGCDKIMFKLQDNGVGVLYERENLGKVFGLRADSFNFDKFRYMCITAGCDYLSNLPGIGLAKAKNFWMKVTNPDLKNTLKKIPTYLKMPGTIVTDEYIERFIKANNTFLYQLVFDPVLRKERPLTPYPPTLSDSFSEMTYCGTYSPPSTALQLALGNLDLHSLSQMSSFCPDNPPCPVDRPKYGVRAGHASVWGKGVGRDVFRSANRGVVSEKKPSAFVMSSSVTKSKGVGEKGEVKVNNSREVRLEMSQEVKTVGRGGEKRKSEAVLVSEDKIEEMLTEDKSPPRKKVKQSLEKMSKFQKMFGATENMTKPGVVTVSKYFAGGESGGVKKANNDVSSEATAEANDESPEPKIDPAIARGRRLSTGASGAWFKDIEQPSSVEGKFIYRAEPSMSSEGEVTTSGTVLKEISNSPEIHGEDLERKKKRNPFAVNVKTKECTSLAPPSPPPCTPPLTSSQLSMYSMDGGSLTFSSQDLGDSQGFSSPPTQDTPPPPPVRQISSPPSSGPRVGLSKFAFNGPSKVGSSSVTKSAKPKSTLGPARVSGLSRGGSGGSKVGGGGLKQPSLLQMFARKCPKAQLGGGSAGTE